MPNLSIRARLTDEGLVSTHSSVGSASSLLASSETDQGNFCPTNPTLLAQIHHIFDTVNGERVNNSTSSLRNAFAGSWAALDGNGAQQPEKVSLTEKSLPDIHVTSMSPVAQEEASPTKKKKKLNASQWLLLSVLMMATMTSSFAICLFPPFFPKIVSLQLAIYLFQW